MQKYYYTNGVTTFGPFTLEELIKEHISRDTKVWFQELSEWQPAGNVPELSVLFKDTPPLIPIPLVRGLWPLNLSRLNN
ncbi:DUF4339 domain-containing protein [Arachidicoccus ginsenosidivorans]|uniref:DUF4339 domain-containing protein n=1 Tax=Arachidicoccus ginsenosidivorans TaxID=496057 RepID=A0A5B8VRR9_9BACT|nr:DUF4339 domain-containing protein [Arachidicoccus ginsenosidivorans]QEC72978.1 DUF4339 domain-containing protein [Arachidicoccus ginsenosidivorans]